MPKTVKVIVDAMTEDERLNQSDNRPVRTGTCGR